MVPVPPVETPPGSRVTVVVPARNEERNIETCVRSLLNQAYPDYEVIVVDDSSEDATPMILQRVAAECPRLRVVSAPPLPPGWAGKCWALATGVGQVNGEWLLFTDADTEHEPSALAATVAFAERHRVDMLSLMPSQILVSFWERSLLPAIFALYLQADESFDEVNDPQSPAAKANGQFLLIRRAAYTAVGGHEAISGEVVEDNALAKRIKGAGYRILLADGGDWLRTRMYRSFMEIWEGIRRNVLSLGYGVCRALASVVLVLTLALGPFVLAGVGIAWLAGEGGGYWPRLAFSFGALGILWLMARGIGMAWGLGIPWVYGLLHPLGLTVFASIWVDSIIMTLSGRGVRWKGRQYREAAGGGQPVRSDRV